MPAKVKPLALAIGCAALIIASRVATAQPIPTTLDPKVAAGAAVTPDLGKPAEPAPGPIVGQEELGPDDFALRYYAALNNTTRVNTEISRLQRLYPGYQPPADLYAAPAEGGVDEEPLWQLFAADKIDELHAAIVAKQKELFNWKPSADLADKLRRKELRLKIQNYWADGRWQDLVEYIKNEDLTGLDQEVDLLWTIGEAFARTKQTDDAVNIYKSIITSAKDNQIRIATVQKAMATLRMNDVEKILLAMPDGANGYASIIIDVTRARMAAYLHDERAEEVPAKDLELFETYARDSREAPQIGLIAWYDYKRRNFQSALDWFKSAISNGGDAMIAHGLAHTLRALEMQRDSEEVAYAWHEPLVNNAILFIDLLERDLTREIPPYIEPERLNRYAKVTAEVASGEGAQALAWYAYNSCQYDVALYWFERAVAWFPKDATVYGYALSLRRMKKDKEFYELVNRYDGLHAKVIETLFPDGYYHPPNPCDGKNAGKLHGNAFRGAAYMAPGPALIPNAAPNYDPSAYTPIEAQKNATQPLDQAALEKQRAWALKSIKGKFPVAVLPDNPLRVRPLLYASQAAAFARASGMEGGMLADPARAPGPLVARRVPGIGAMPYENYGFSLLPGWNGVETATWPPAAQQIAPNGTQWANQDADPARAGLQTYSATGGPAAGAAGATGPYGGGPRSLPGQPIYGSTAPRPAPAYGQYPQPVRR